jgi:LysM repeat protein
LYPSISLSMKKLILPVLLFLFTLTVTAQKKETLFVKKGDDNGLYLEHKVVAKETYYSIGRLYNISPAIIADFNTLDINKGLNIDQKIRIPLIDANFTQQGNTGTPVYYKVKEKDGLYRVSIANKSVPIDNIKRWNNLKSDNIAEGSRLIIGYLLTGEIGPVTVSDIRIVVDTVAKEPQPEVKTDEKKPVEKKPEPVALKQEVKPVQEQGYFRTSFEQQIKLSPPSKNETVTSSIFKTSSGWQDEKYYLLIDKVQPGTIVRVTNPANNVSVYAKVLGEMSGIRQNEGLDIRISNAAAAALQVTEPDKFIVKIIY